MKSLLITACLVSFSAFAADTCVSPKLIGNKEVMLVNFFAQPDSAHDQPIGALRQDVPLWAKEPKTGKDTRLWVKLFGTSESAPYAEGAFVGWALRAQFRDLKPAHCR